jgi:hypothetical protein
MLLSISTISSEGEPTRTVAYGDPGTAAIDGGDKRREKELRMPQKRRSLS